MGGIRLVPPGARPRSSRLLVYADSVADRQSPRHVRDLLRRAQNATTLDQNLIEQFTHIAGIAIERSQSEAALRRSEALLAEAQRLNRTGSFVWRPSTDELIFSKEMYRIYEFDESEPLTVERSNSRVHPDDLGIATDLVERTRRGVPAEAEFDLRLRFPDGSIKYVRVVLHGARDESGNVEFTGTVQDVTERRRAEDALAKLQCELAHVARVSTLGALTASIAHEVNQPLAAIITNASTCLRLLGDDPPRLDAARETARRTIRDGRRAADVVSRLRALFAEGDSTSEAVDLNEAAQEVIALSLNELQRHRVTLRTELQQNLPPVSGDRIQLQQVILNLLLNGVQAMHNVDDRPRELTVRTELDEGERVRLTVRDVGIGFEAQDAERLFEPFHTTKSGGMGVGLFVSRTIVENHQGCLWAAQNDGPGATFAFVVPCRPEHASVPASEDVMRTS
jgi:signal transduction histidine kinase